MKHHRSLIFLSICLVLFLGSIFSYTNIRQKPSVKPTISEFQPSLSDQYQYVAEIPSVGINANFDLTKTELEINITRNTSQLTLTIPIQTATAQNTADKLIYQDSDKNIQLAYSLIDKGLKEEIVLTNKPQTNSILVPLKLKNLTVSPNPNGILMFYDPSGAYQFHFVAPYATDANGKITRKIKYSLEPNGSLETSSYLLTIDLDTEFLTNPKTKYPITIDPTIVNGACWGIAGSCDAGCTNSSYSSNTVYSTCELSSCNCYRWRRSGGDAPSGYTDGTIAYYYDSWNCSTSIIGYGLHGSIAGCYDIVNNPASCQDVAKCYEGLGGMSYKYVYGYTYYGGGTCYEVTPQNVFNDWPGTYELTCTNGPYCTGGVVSNSTTKYLGSGTCAVDGSGNCYKLTSSASYNTGNGACPSTYCTSGYYYGSVSTCSWFPTFFAPTTCTYEATPSVNQITINWNDPNTTENGYYIEKSTDGGAFANLTTTAANVITYPDTSVSVSHTYQYRVRATLGSDYSDWCTTSLGNFQIGDFKFENLQMEGLKID